MSFRESVLFNHIAGAQAATQIKTGLGVLHTLTLNQVGATPGVITVQDGTVATPVATIAIITPVASTSCATMIMDVRFNVGLVVTTTGATSDITLCYE